MEIGFYQLTVSTVEKALPRLVEKILGMGLKIVVVTGSIERAEVLDHALWVYTPLSFLPHGRAGDPAMEAVAARQPVWITTTKENPNQADVLVLTDGATAEASGQILENYRRCVWMFDGHDAPSRDQSREMWQQYKRAGYTLTYWTQTSSGGWISGL